MSLNWRRTALVSATLAALIAVIYWPALRCDFINSDDPDYVTENSIVQRGLSVEGVKWAFNDWRGKPYWHPLTWLSHMLDCQLFGLNARWHHATNVLFHLANSILLLLFLSSLTGAFWRSAVVAAFFALHPLQVETVAWVAERKSVLSTLFWLLASAAYIKFARTKKAVPYVTSIALFACGLMSKPAVVTLPFAFLLLDFWPLKRFSLAESWHERARAGLSLLAEKLPFLLLSAASAVITIGASEQMGIKAGEKELPLLYRIENAAVSYAQYLKKIFLPFDLGIFYPHPRVWPTETVVISALILIVITILVVACLRRRAYLAVGWFWFIGVLVPVIGIVQAGYQAMADRFVYVPLIGISIMIAWGVADLSPAMRAKSLAICALFGSAMIYFVGGTVSQLRHWKDSEAVFRRAVAVTKNNYIAHLNLGAALFTKGESDEAEFQARQALKAHNKDPLAYMLLGAIYNRRQDFSAAISNYTRALELNPNAASARFSLAVALLNGGRPGEAKQIFLALAEMDQYEPEAHAYLGQIFMAEKNAGAAIQHYREALKSRPDWPMAANNLAWVLATNPDAQLRNGAEAVQLAERACELSRNEEPLLIGILAAAYAEAGRFADAIAAGKRAQALAFQKGLLDLAQRNAELVKLYEAGKPFRDGP